MPLDLPAVRRLLDAFDLDTLFVEHLGWDRHKARVSVPVGDKSFHLRAFAEKRGFAAYVCEPDADGRMPDSSARIRIDREVGKSNREHLVIYANGAKTEQVWQWVRRRTVADEPGHHRYKPREFPWRKGDRSGLLLERVLPSITFGLAEEDKLTLPDVTSRAAGGFDVEKVTKRFFERFQAEHAAFHKFIEGIEGVADRDWYASVMLNRLMFCYFIQKKGLLDGDHEYLKSRMTRLQATKGKDKFWSFYRHFLLKLFHEGLSTKPSHRTKELDALIGKIPYLNGGLFDVHELEAKHSDIRIPDKAFETIFAFFDEFRWHLDERPLRDNNEINPDVLGYIFEKYINQKQMGAYYTKEDITDYISTNTIIPFILDQAAKNCAVAFKSPSGEQGSGSVWKLLKETPDRYIHDSMLKGIVDDAEKVIPLPADIAAGVADIARRGSWNKPAPQPFALPNETWREHVARRERCLELRRKLKDGGIAAVNDLVTLNLDIQQFAEDVIANSEGSDLLKALWNAIESVTVLDPTCGSGAFLFAALNVLEPLYDACLIRMEAFLDDLRRAETAGEKVHPDKYKLFKGVLAHVALHPNKRYFVLKSIVVNNLYGVDIMEEACEICKLRLFLKLVAQVKEGAIDSIEPLPDIDFNIRAGNTLVGFTSLDDVKESMSERLDFGKDLDRIVEQAEKAASAFRLFHEMHTQHDVKVKDLADGKKLLRSQLDVLNGELNRYLAAEFNQGSSAASVQKWVASHQPFHWLVDFYSIVAQGGFDVVIGNPPYVRASTVKYLSARDRAERLPDLYGYVLLRSLRLVRTSGRCAMIVPLSISFGEDFAALRRRLTEAGTGWFSSFDNIPAALFAGVSQRCTIWLGAIGGQSKDQFSTQLHRWRSSTRTSLFGTLVYSACAGWRYASDGIPRIASNRQMDLTKLIAQTARGGISVIVPSRKAKHFIGFAPAARNFVSGYIDPPPVIDVSSLEAEPTDRSRSLGLPDADATMAGLAVVIGELHFWHWLVHGDGFDVINGTVSELIETVRLCDPVAKSHLVCLGRLLNARRFEALVYKKNAGKFVGNFNFRGHAFLTRRADLVLLAALGCSRDVAVEVFGHVQRVLAINESAGEKSIPASVKAIYPPNKIDLKKELAFLADIDKWLVAHYGFSPPDLDFLLNKEVQYRVGEVEDE